MILQILLCLFARSGCVVEETTLHGFIADTRRIIGIISQNYEKGWPDHQLRQYNITDTVTVKRRHIRLLGVCIRTRTLIRHMQIFACSTTEFTTQFFSVDVNYSYDGTPGLDAYICNVNSANQTLSGTEIMLLVHHILAGIGVKSCSLQNCANIRYKYYSGSYATALNAFIPTIDLRCIRGKRSDWYAEFGYSNANKDQIATEMTRIHDIVDFSKDEFIHANLSLFGPWLCALWNKSDKTDFHMAYQNNLWRFSYLKHLRDANHRKWITSRTNPFLNDI